MCVFLMLPLECWPSHEVVCVGTAVSDLVLPFTGDRFRPCGCRGVNHVCLHRLEGPVEEAGVSVMFLG